MLIGSGGPLLGRADAALRLIVNLFYLVASVFNRLTVSISLLSHLVDLGLNRRSRVLHILFRRAATGEQSACHDTRRREKCCPCHSPKTSLSPKQSKRRFR